MRLCLDTSAYSHFRRGEAQAVNTISRASEVCIPVIVLGELRAGFRHGGRSDKNERELSEFLQHRLVRVLDVDDEVSQCYAEIYADLRAAGTPVPTNDLWIAAIALKDGLTVLTYDQHFSAVRSVGIKLLKRSHE